MTMTASANEHEDVALAETRMKRRSLRGAAAVVMVLLAGILLVPRILAWVQGERLAWHTWVAGDRLGVSAQPWPPGVGATAGEWSWTTWPQPGYLWFVGLLPEVLTLGCLGLGLWAGWQLVSRVCAGQAFDRTAVRWARMLAGCVLAYGTVVPAVATMVVEHVATSLAVLHPEYVGHVSYAPNELWWIPLGLLLLVLAEVWRHGARLRDDVDGLV